jgi:CHAT domain-containing protein
LDDLLIAPARALMSGRRLVCIVPDGVLWELPFQALCDAAGRYLIQDQAVAYAPSLRALVALRDRQQQRRGEKANGAAADWNLLVLANPDLGQVTEVASPLLGSPVAIPGTEDQGRRIAQMFGKRSRLCVGAEATEQRARELAPKHRVLPFATHGIFEAGSPMVSGIRLARGDEDDGYWEAREILQTRLEAELVVLSACETARAQLRQGEGIWGLSWALLTAGSTANVLSQWAVADQSTAELMTAFYRHWQHPDAGGGGGGARITKAEALQRAQLELLEGRSAGGRKHAHPFHWAPFILIGDWR